MSALSKESLKFMEEEMEKQVIKEFGTEERSKYGYYNLGPKSLFAETPEDRLRERRLNDKDNARAANTRILYMLSGGDK